MTQLCTGVIGMVLLLQTVRMSGQASSGKALQAKRVPLDLQVCCPGDITGKPRTDAVSCVTTAQG